MTDIAALAALVVAVVALVIASAQLTQQLLATAYVIRKCDRIVTGGLTKGGTRKWHWRQFRFTVRYQAIVFALPEPIYSGLGINSTMIVNPPSPEVWERAVATRPQRNTTQGCWVSLVQDLVMSCCLEPEDISTREESGDRIPEDLTVAPIRVDCMTLLLSCIAMGMQVFKFSPTTGEMTIVGGVGSISSSTHPILGCLLHYSVFSDEPTIGLEAFKRHGRALRQSEGIWANAVFGRFRDRSHRPEMLSLFKMITRKSRILAQAGWPEDNREDHSESDTIAGAACFMVFGHIDFCEIAPPSVVRRWTAHFAEVIVKAHHIKILSSESDVNVLDGKPKWHFTLDSYTSAVKKKGYSSPFSPTFTIDKPVEVETVEASSMLLTQGLWDNLRKVAANGRENFSDDQRDPSSYCPPAVMWDLVCLADTLLYHEHCRIPEPYRKKIQMWTDRVVARAIRKLCNVGPPSWGNASDVVKSWPLQYAKVCEGFLKRVPNDLVESFEETSGPLGERFHFARSTIRLCAELSILRSAYVSVMMRAAHPLGPGLTEDSNVETALAYMA